MDGGRGVGTVDGHPDRSRRSPHACRGRAARVVTGVAKVMVRSLQATVTVRPAAVDVVHADEGSHVDMGGTGIEERLLTPVHERRLQLIRSVIAPGGRGEDALSGIGGDGALAGQRPGGGAEGDARLGGDVLDGGTGHPGLLHPR